MRFDGSDDGRGSEGNCVEEARDKVFGDGVDDGPGCGDESCSDELVTLEMVMLLNDDGGADGDGLWTVGSSDLILLASTFGVCNVILMGSQFRACAGASSSRIRF